MITRNMLFLFASAVPLAILSACEVVPVTSQVEDIRLDQLVSSMDKTLANQGAVTKQLLQQQRQLEITQQRLELMSQNINEALKESVEDRCPRAESCLAPQNSSDKILVGALETIWLPGLDMALKARIDTGAKTSSIDANNIELFERDGKRWVGFDILNPRSGVLVSLERRLQRTVGIIQSGSQLTKSRPVVKMSVMIGNLEQIAEFSLSSRSHAGYQALIGRSILKDVMIVDVSRENVAPSALSEMPAAGIDGPK